MNNKIIKIYTSSFGEESLVCETRYTDVAKAIISFLWEEDYSNIRIERYDDSCKEYKCE